MLPSDPADCHCRLPTLHGLVLAGGRSTRMGQDKSLLTYHGLPHRQYLAGLLRPLCTEVWVSLNASQVPLPDERVLRDADPDAGPLGGIRAASAHAPTAAWLVVACDWPLLTAGTLRVLAEHRQLNVAATTFRSPEDGTLEPLLTVYEPACGPALEAAWQRGERSPRRLLGELSIQVLDVPNPAEWLNANTPETYRALRQREPRP